MSQCKEIIKIHTLVCNQLMSEKYCPMLQYAWFVCNNAYVIMLFTFKNVEQIYFNPAMNNAICSLIDEYESYVFLKCSYYEMFLCFGNFYTNYHFHNV